MVQVVDANEFEQMKQQMNKMEALLMQLVKKPVATPVKSKLDVVVDELDNWVLLKEAWRKMKITKGIWYRRGYKKILKTTKKGKTVLVYLPSVLKYIEEGAIN